MPRVTRAVALVLLALGAAATACGRDAPPRAALLFPRAPIVLISIDTLRADHLAAYGYRGGSTPAIDRFASGGIVFEDAYSQIPLTLPSHATLLSGRLPTRHGVRDNIGFALASDQETLALPAFKAIVEPHLAVFEEVLEVDVDRARGQLVDDRGEREIVRRDQPDRAAIEQAAQHA